MSNHCQRILGSETRHSAAAATITVTMPTDCGEVGLQFGQASGAPAEPATWTWTIRERASGTTIMVLTQYGSSGPSEQVRLPVNDNLRAGFEIVFGTNGGSVIITYFAKE